MYKSTNPNDSKFHIMWSGGALYNRHFTLQARTLTNPDSFLNMGINTDNPLVSAHIVNRVPSGGGVVNSTVDPSNIIATTLRLENITNGQAVIQHFLAKDGAGNTKQLVMGINPTINTVSGTGAFVLSPSGSNEESISIDLGTGNMGIGVINLSRAKLSVGTTDDNALYLQSNAATLPGGAAGGMMILHKVAAAVSGDIWQNFVANGATVGYISSNSATTVAYNTTSDIRLKDNIKETHYGIDDVMKIQVKDYNYKADKDKTPNTGFIAQQLNEIFPIAVTKGGEDAEKSPWAIDYGKVTPLLTKAIQDQQKEIEQLISENNKLQKNFAELHQQVKDLQQMIGVKKTEKTAKVASK